MGGKESLRSASQRFGPGRFAYRLRVLWGDRALARQNPAGAVHYLRHSRELTNFTYELANEPEIANFVAAALGTDPDAVTALLGELRSDTELTDDLRRRLRQRSSANQEPMLGKRRALYCVVRLLRPRVIVESGVKDGLGSAVLLRALERNEAEGDPGMLLAFDIEPDAGWLVDWKAEPERQSLFIGDVRETLGPVLEENGVDLFINDSLHSYEHERFEFETAVRCGRSPRLALYCDDSSLTPALGEVCRGLSGRSSRLKEVPKDHYWRGNEIALCVLDGL